MYVVSLAMDQIWDRSLPVLINDRQVKTLSPEDMIIILCFHGLKHSWQSLEWLADLTYMISNHQDIKWLDVFARAENIGLKRIVLIGLFLAHEHGGNRYGNEIENTFISDIKVIRLAREIQQNLFKSGTSTVRPCFYLKSRERLKDKNMFLFYFFPHKVLVILQSTMKHIKGVRTGC